MKWSIPERVIEKGRRYVKEGRVLSVTENEEEKTWHAQVMGHEMYLVDLDGTAKEADTCQCLFWQEKGYCKHTVAVELYLRELGLNRFISGNQKEKKVAPKIPFYKLFTQGLTESQWKKGVKTQEAPQYTFQIERLNTNPYYTDRDFLGVSLKIGYEGQRQYVVKNIGDFLLSYMKEEKFFMNQQYPFFLGKENTTPKVNCALTALYEIYESQQMLLQGGFSKKGKVDKKYLVLPNQALEEVLTKIFATERGVLLIEGHFEKLTFKKGLPLKSFVDEKEKGYQLQIEDPLETYFSYYHSGFAKGTFYQATLEEEMLYQTLTQLLSRKDNPEIFYPSEEVSQLFSKVLPLLEDLGEVVLSKKTAEHVTAAPLELSFYLRRYQGEILLRIDYQYDTEIFSTDEKHQQLTNKVVVRHLKAEETVDKLVRQLGFSTHALGYKKEIPTREALYLFFTKELEELRKLGKVYVGKKLQSLFLPAKKHAPKVQVENEDSWFAVRFDISGIEEKEVTKVLQALVEKEAFYETNEGKILDLTEESFQETAEILKQIRGKLQKDGSFKLPNYQGLQVKELMKDYQHTSWDHQFSEMLKDLVHPEKFNAPLPQHLKADLRNYQITGFKWLKMLSTYQLGGILADDMGLGKTLQAITYFLSEKEEGHLSAPALIVAPASLTYNWQSEIEKFAPTLKSTVIIGNKEERQNLLEEHASEDILITSYASFRQDVEDYEKLDLAILCLDEAQMVKNAATKTSQALRKLQVPKRFALSGTPIENNLLELWALFSIIMPGFFPAKSRFKELELETIRKMIQPFVLRREKQKVLKELPDKIETSLYSSLLPEQKTLYLAYLKEMQETVSKMDKKAFSKNRLGILSGLTRLRQICCDPKMFLPDFTGESGKLQQLKDFLVTAKENKRKVLLFSQFTKMLDIIEKELTPLGIQTSYLSGSTPAKERLEMVNDFNEGQKDVFLISLKAGGTGLNLVGADTVILFDLWWNPAVEEQAASRAHRLGQKKVVEVFRMIAKGTVEEKMAALQEEKRALFDTVLNGNEETIQKLTEEDIRQILSMGEE